MSYSSISQTVIPETTNNQCAVCLDTILGRKAVKDLITGDAAKEELKVELEINHNLELALQQSEEYNFDLSQQNSTLEYVIEGKDKMIGLKDREIQAKNDKIKKEKKKTLFYKITTGIAIIGGAALLIHTN